MPKVTGCEAVLMGYFATVLLLMLLVAVVYLKQDGIVFGTTVAALVALYLKRENVLTAVRGK